MECSFGKLMAENNDVKADELFMTKEEVFKAWEEDMNAFEKYFKERFPKLKTRCSEEDIDKLNNTMILFSHIQQNLSLEEFQLMNNREQIEEMLQYDCANDWMKLSIEEIYHVLNFCATNRIGPY